MTTEQPTFLSNVTPDVHSTAPALLSLLLAKYKPYLNIPDLPKIGEAPGFAEKYLSPEIIAFLRQYGTNPDEAENVAIMMKNLKLDDPNREVKYNMKQILKSLLVLAIVAGTTVGATGAYFSSSVTAADNEINTGVLAMAVDSTRAHNYVGTWNTGTGLGWDGTTVVGVPFDAYVVAYDLDGVSTAGSGPLEAWDLAAPGVYSAYTGAAGFETLSEGNRSVWFTVRNWGSVSAKAHVAFTGDWTNVRTSPACVTAAATPNDALIQSENVHVYRNGASGCENHEECRNLRDSLITQGYTLTNDTDLNAALNYTAEQTLDGSSFALSSDGTTAGNVVTLDGGEFAIVRMDLNFDETQSNNDPDINCYQGATYLYDVNVTGTQVADPSWI